MLDFAKDAASVRRMVPLRDDSSGVSARISTISTPFTANLEKLDAFLRNEQTSAFEPEIQELVGYCFKNAGKRLRPILVFASAGSRDDASEDLLKAAALVELVHLATLVHDDILDDAALRHRMPTLHAEYGTDIAVLLGDSLFAHALELAASYPSNVVCRRVAAAVRRVCAGEIAQTSERGNAGLTLARYYKLIEMKTAELFEVSAWLGAFLSDHSEEQSAACAEFARRLGIAYQIYDDLADLVQETPQAGKTLGTDWETGKFTLPVLILIEKLEAFGRSDEAARLRAGDMALTQVRALCVEEGALADSVAAFETELDLAEAALAQADSAQHACLAPMASFLRQAGERFR